MRVSDNKKHDKDFYRNFIHKIFVSKSSINLDKRFAMSHHVSLTQSKRNACTSMRKKLVQDSSTSTSLHGKTPSAKSLSKTIHVTSRNTSMEAKKLSRRQNIQNLSPYKTKLKESEPVSKGKSGFQKIHK